MGGFLEHCLRGTNYATGQVGTPLDFVAFHAKGAPTTTNGHVRTVSFSLPRRGVSLLVLEWGHPPTE